MGKYTHIVLKVDNLRLTDLDSRSKLEREALLHSNAIYIYHGSKSHNVYIGQTKHFIERHKEHSKEEKFINADFDKVLVIFSRHFNNRSSLDDVEKQMITYFVTDYSDKPKVDSPKPKWSVLNDTLGNTVNEYEGYEDVPTEVILPAWEEVLYNKLHWVTTPTIEKLRTNALVKYSPIKTLTPEQDKLINEIVDHPDTNYVINGDAGTGKTVLLTNLVARLLKSKKRGDIRIGVVIQPNWEKTAKNIFSVFGMDTNNLFIGTSTEIIKDNHRYDIIVVDESHKLSRKYSKQHPSFNQVYADPEFRNCKSHLEILQKMGKQIVLMYDVLQAIRPANLTRDEFKKLTAGYQKEYLTTQFRIQVEDNNYTSDDYVNGIKYLLYKDTGLLDESLTHFNPDFNRAVFNDTSEDDAYFGYFTDKPLHKIREWLSRDEDFNPEHIDRILAGLCEPWKQSDGKDPTITHWHEDDIHLRWNSKQENWINNKGSENEVGSVFAVQGVDLNKVGVLIGNDLEVGPDNKLRGNPSHFYNVNGKFPKAEMDLPEDQFEFTLFVLNIYYVLLTRGIDGIRLGFWKNDAFRKYMEETLDIHHNQ